MVRESSALNCCPSWNTGTTAQASQGDAAAAAPHARGPLPPALGQRQDSKERSLVGIGHTQIDDGAVDKVELNALALLPGSRAAPRRQVPV